MHIWYLCIEQCEPEEWEARWRLLNLHDHMSRLKIFKAMEGADYEVAHFEEGTEQVKGSLVKTEYFQSLPEQQRIHYLKGKHAFFQSQDEIIKSAGGNVREFRFRYCYLSNYTHSFPMGFYRMVESKRGTGIESDTEIAYTGICLEWASEYLAKAKLEFARLWEEYNG